LEELHLDLVAKLNLLDSSVDFIESYLSF